MRVYLDRKKDQATIHFGAGRQSHYGGGTYLVMTEPVEIQLGFEGDRELVFLMVRPASGVLPEELLAEAEERAT